MPEGEEAVVSFALPKADMGRLYSAQCVFFYVGSWPEARVIGRICETITCMRFQMLEFINLLGLLLLLSSCEYIDCACYKNWAGDSCIVSKLLQLSLGIFF